MSAHTPGPWNECDLAIVGPMSRAAQLATVHPSHGYLRPEYCTECGLKGHCRCDEADRKYDEWKDEGAFL